MKQFASRLAAILAASLLSVGRASAALADPATMSGLSGETNIVTIVTNIIKAILDFVLIIAVAYVVYAGIRLIMSAGDDSAKDSAKKTIIYVVIGIIVILLARVLVMFVNGLF
ncbi:MAG: TrbC/VirB2 family protein [Patescibacteria group bacterium]